MESAPKPGFRLPAAVVAAALGLALACAGRPGPGAFQPPRTENTGATSPRLVIFPFENLSGVAAPAPEIRKELREALAGRGLDILPEAEVETVLARHRIRYTAGVAGDVGRALLAETGAPFVLVGSVDLFDQSENPKLALTVRLVGTGETPRLLWMHSEALSGQERPGFLGLGVIGEYPALQNRVVNRMADRITAALRATGGGQTPLTAGEPARRRHRPRTLYRGEGGAGGGLGRVAVLPFVNETGRPKAGELVSLHFVRELAARPGVDIVEPGVVREALLRARVIQEGGLSFGQAEVLRAELGVDLVVTGRVLEYQEAGVAALVPRAGFSVLGIGAARRQVVWSSTSFNRGDDGVFFFDAGLVGTAHQLTAAMVRAAVEQVSAASPAGASKARRD